MGATFLKVLWLFMAIMFTSSCTDQLTFVVTDIETPSDMSEWRVQKIRDDVELREVNLLFSDNDVRMTAKFGDKGTRSVILQKIGDDLYRGEDGYVYDLELNIVLGYISSCKLTVFDKDRYNSSMKLVVTMTLKRK